MAQTAAITTAVTITAKSIGNNSVTSQFNSVTKLNFDFFKGMVCIIDSVQGEFYFSLTAITTLTYTIAGTATTVVMS